MSRDVPQPKAENVQEVRSQGPDKYKIRDFLRGKHEISAQIEKHLGEVEEAHQDIKILQKHLDSFTEHTTEFETPRQDIRQTLRDADQALEEFNRLYANKSEYKSAFEKFDQEFDKLYHEIQKKTRAHIKLDV